MNVIFVIGLIVLATFSLCEGTTPSVNAPRLQKDALVIVPPGKDIKVFGLPNASNNGHLVGGMQFVNNQIIVPEPGVYFVYATLRVHGHDQRFALTVNSHDVFYGVPVGSGSISISGTYCLKKGDTIGLKAYDKVNFW